MQQWAKVFSVNSTVFWETEQTSIVYAEYYTVGLGREGEREKYIKQMDGRDLPLIDLPLIEFCGESIFALKLPEAKMLPHWRPPRFRLGLSVYTSMYVCVCLRLGCSLGNGCFKTQPFTNHKL